MLKKQLNILNEAKRKKRNNINLNYSKKINKILKEQYNKGIIKNYKIINEKKTQLPITKLTKKLNPLEKKAKIKTNIKKNRATYKKQANIKLKYYNNNYLK